jgi:hypothetical protein
MKAVGLYQEGRKVMNKLILFAAALLIASQASAYAQGDHASRHHRHLMSSHAQIRGYEGGIDYRGPEYAPQIVAPSYYDSPSYYNSDPSAEGRTSGG